MSFDYIFRLLSSSRSPGLMAGVPPSAGLLHHGYTGAIPDKAGIKGLRFRVGNVQVGDDNLLEELFPEPRFNAWWSEKYT